VDFDRVALVTGAARGIGAATVAELLRQGYAITALDACTGNDVSAGIGYPLASPADLDNVAALSTDLVLPIVSDVRNRDALDAAVEHTLSRFGRLDAVVAGAGVVAGGLPQWKTPEADLKTLMDVNVLGVWNTAAATVPVMLSSATPAGCRFVAVASAAGERGLFNLAGYCASKHAVIGIIRGLAADLVGTGLAVMAVSPGSTKSMMLTATADLYQTTTQQLAEHQGLRRVIEPGEIAATIAHCCSLAGAALNGSVLSPDGGFGI
jgi:SDR family mycofactocin-dependent oxidoreductase